MEKTESDKIQDTIDRVLELAEEVENAGEASVDGAGLERARAVLHKWVDEMKAVVVNPGLGRVTLIHENGRQSSIASPDLPFLLSVPVSPRTDA